VVVVVVDPEDIQMVDMNFDKDCFLVVDRDFVENQYLLKKQQLIFLIFSR
jgi:hypothetical protein